MEDLVMTKRYDQEATSTGSILMPVPRSSGGSDCVWRVRLFDKHSTECVFFLLKLRNEFYLKACDFGTKACVRMNLPTDKIREYKVVCNYWHEVVLHDDRKFALRLDCSDPNQDKFLENLKKVFSGGNVLKEISGGKGDSVIRGIRIGPPISSVEATKRALTDIVIKEHGKSPRQASASEKRTLLDSKALRSRPLPPIPDAELEELMSTPPPKTKDASDDLLGSVHDLLRSFTEPAYYGAPCAITDDEVLDGLTDESILLEEAIQRGDVANAAHWAAELAKRKSDVFISHVSDLNDPITYRRMEKNAYKYNVTPIHSGESLYVYADKGQLNQHDSIEDLPDSTPPPPPIRKPSTPRIVESTYVDIINSPPPSTDTPKSSVPPKLKPKPTPRSRTPNRIESRAVQATPRARTPNRIESSEAQGSPSTFVRRRVENRAVQDSQTEAENMQGRSSPSNLNVIKPKSSVRSRELWCCWNCNTPNAISLSICSTCDQRRQ